MNTGSKQVIAWLKTPAGESWSQERVAAGGIALERHELGDGVFATVFDDDEFAGSLARWPEPFAVWDLDIDDDSERFAAMADEAMAVLFGVSS